jgi:hypothetical protein
MKKFLSLISVCVSLAVTASAFGGTAEEKKARGRGPGSGGAD